MPTCAFRNCYYPAQKFFYFPLPSKNGRRLTWIERSGNTSLNVNSTKLRACALHFNDDQFQTPQKLRLNFNALPNDWSECATSGLKVPPTQSSESKQILYKQHLRLKRQHNALKLQFKKLKSEYKAHVGNMKNLTPIARFFIRMQLHKVYTNCYPSDARDFIIKFYLKSPSAYKYLKNYLKLPAVRSIQNWMVDPQMKPCVDNHEVIVSETKDETE